MYYGDQRESMVNISEALRSRGWEIFGYSPDQSDSMTDYYCPARWGGIAKKNGFVLCIDIKDYSVKSYSGKEEYEYTISYASTVNNDKIQKLQALADDSAATEEEKDTALKMIEKFQNNQEEKEQDRERTKVLKFKYPEFMANPKACNWHVEKDGKIFAKGKGAFQFSSLPYDFDPSTGEVKEWRSRKESWTEEEQKEINKFLKFIAKIDNVASGVANMGDGTDETEEAGIEAQAKEGYEKVTVNITKTVTKPVKVERKTIQKDDVLGFSYHGGYWLIIDVWQNQKGVNCYTYEILGSERRGYQRLKNGKRYYQTETHLLKDIETGKASLYEMKTFDETTPTEKWVKIDQTKKTTKKTNNTTKEGQQERPKEAITIDYEFTITPDTDTRDDSEIWIVKITDKLSKEEYKELSNQLKTISGYYSRFKHGFLFKYNPAEVLKGNNTELEGEQQQEQSQQTQEQNDLYKQEEIEDGFIYDCHFKAWDLEIKDIKTMLNVYEIPYIDWVEKVGFKSITVDQARQAKQISDANGSIFFIDKKEEQKVEEQEEMNNNDDILSKFDSFEVENKSRITAEDQEFCKEQEKDYSVAINMLKDFLSTFKDISGIDLLEKGYTNKESKNKYLDWYKFDKITELAKETKTKFIHNIVWYFEKQYNITIDSNSIREKYDFDITYDNILDEIFIQLDGFSFTEKAVNELKEKTRTTYYYNDYRKSSNMNIKGNKIIIDGSYAYKDTIWNKYSLRGDFEKIFTALYHFENDQIPSDNTELHNRYCGYNNERNKSNYDKYEPYSLDKVKAIKFFKNGKLEIEFKASTNAEYFAKEYLGYREQKQEKTA